MWKTMLLNKENMVTSTARCKNHALARCLLVSQQSGPDRHASGTKAAAESSQTDAVRRAWSAWKKRDAYVPHTHSCPDTVDATRRHLLFAAHLANDDECLASRYRRGRKRFEVQRTPFLQTEQQLCFCSSETFTTIYHVLCSSTFGLHDFCIINGSH